MSLPPLLTRVVLKRRQLGIAMRNQISQGDCAFPSTQPVSALLCLQLYECQQLAWKDLFPAMSVNDLPPILHHPSSDFSTPPADISGIFLGGFFIQNEPNENRCCLVSFFEEMRTACASYSKSLPSVRWTPRSSLWQLNMRGWQYKQRWIDAFPRGEDKEGLRGRQRVREGKKRLKDEGGNATGSVTVSCRLVSSFLPSALGRSLAHNMESINPHRIPLSPPDTCPVCLPLSVCFYMLLIDVYLGSWKSS